MSTLPSIKLAPLLPLAVFLAACAHVPEPDFSVKVDYQEPIGGCSTVASK